MNSKEIKTCTFKESVNLSKKDGILSSGNAQNMIQDQMAFYFKGENQIDIKEDIDENQHYKQEEEDKQIQKGEEWTVWQDKILIQLHNQKGNKWVEIAKAMHKSDNSVKNHYHSKLRKALRKINKCIADHLKAQCKAFKNNILSKIVQTSELIYTIEEDRKSLPNLAFKLKNDVLAFAECSQQQLSVQQIKEVRKLVSQITEFNQLLKKQDKGTNSNKLSSNKYKGKEIISLISEHSTKKEVHHKNTEPEVFTQNRGSPKAEVVSEEREKIGQLQRALTSDTNNFLNSSMGISDFYYLFRQSTYPLFYSYLPNRYNILSGKASSFTYYTPEENKISQQITMWGSASNIQFEVSTFRQGKNQIEDSCTSKVQQI